MAKRKAKKVVKKNSNIKKVSEKIPDVVLTEEESKNVLIFLARSASTTQNPVENIIWTDLYNKFSKFAPKNLK